MQWTSTCLGSSSISGAARASVQPDRIMQVGHVGCFQWCHKACNRPSCWHKIEHGMKPAAVSQQVAVLTRVCNDHVDRVVIPVASKAGQVCLFRALEPCCVCCLLLC
jgi:hypothetical protein